MQRRRCAIAVRVAAAVLALVGAGAAVAATLSVTVTDKDGEPAMDVAVLVRYPILPARAPAPVISGTIAQERMRFLPFLTIVNPGSTLRFVNRDNFDHHIRGNAAPTAEGGRDFEARLGPAGARSLDIRLEGRGLYALGCHLHSTMRGYVLVTDTPWFGKTDVNGVLKLEGLPDGVVDISVVHPEQFAAPVPQRITLAGEANELKSQLAFTPRRRRP
jgi:plastocyanin